MLIATKATTFKTACIERGVDARFSRTACERADHGRKEILERVLELPGIAGEVSFLRWLPR